MHHSLSSLLLSFMLIALVATQTCPGFYAQDLVQSGQKAIVNPYNDGYSFTVTTSVNYAIPASGIQIASTSATIGNYNPLENWGYNYFISGQRQGNTNQVTFQLIIRSDNSWQSIQIGYLFNSRNDLAVGNFEADVSLFNQLSPNIYEVKYYIADQLPDTNYQVATFISGFSIYIKDYQLDINQHYYKKNTKELGVIFHSSTTSILSIIFSYVIYPDAHPTLTFNYNTVPKGRGSYFLSGPTAFDGRTVSYEEWSIENRFLACTDNACSKSCILAEQCIATYGNVFEGRCYFCQPGVVFYRGRCQRSCGPNQIYFAPRGLCFCTDGYERVNQECVKKEQCPPNQSKINGVCTCNPGYALWQDSCRKCPDTASSTLDRSTCVCQDDQIFKPIDNICAPKCTVPNQHWVVDRCLCVDNYIAYSDQCRLCPANSQANGPKTTCICTNNAHVYFFNENACRACPAGQFPNNAKTECLCPQNTKNENGVCVPTCGLNRVYNPVDSSCPCAFGFIEVGNICVERCSINEHVDPVTDVCVCLDGYAKFAGPCKQCPTSSVPNKNKDWCICSQSNSILNPSRLLCEQCPANSSPNAAKDKCVCNNGYVADQSGVCVRISNCPPRASFNDQTLACECTNANEHLIGGICQPCPANEGWNGNQCVCKSDYYRINGVCRTCDPKSTYNGKDCVCNLGYYGNRDECNACHISCSQCSGPEASQCTKCADISLVLENGFCSQGGVCPIGSYLSNSMCESCIPYCRDCESQLDCKQCAPGFVVESFSFQGQTLSSCSEVCGDSRRFQQECDDGNNNNGDGCSSECKVEPGWTCVDGSSVKKDTCSNFIPSSTTLTAKGSVNKGTYILQSVRASYLPSCITDNECAECFKALDVRVIESFVPVKVIVNFIPASKYQFSVEYHFDGGVLVTSAIRVSIRLNREFYSCFSADDFNQVLDLTIDPTTLAICNKEETLDLNAIANFTQSQTELCGQRN